VRALTSDVRTRVSPLVALVVAIVAVSTSAILIRWSSAPSLVKAFYRVLFTTVLVAPVALRGHSDDFRQLSHRDLIGAGGAGLALAIHFSLWFESLAWTSVAASVTLVQSQPVFVACGAALFLDEYVSRRVMAGLGIALCGMVVMSASELIAGAGSVTPAPLYGNALAVVGAIMAAVYVLAGRALRQRVSLLPYVTVVYVVCTAVLFVFVLVRGLPLVAYPPEEWLLFLAMAIGPGIFGHTVINWALAHVESSVVSVSLLGEPVGSTLLALVLLSEVPGVLTIVGGMIVLGGIVVTARR
jgi:drug/metabolite transporter (DMT)-like permease